MRHSVLIFFILFFLLISFVGGSVFTTYTQFISEGPLEKRTEIIIPAGTTLRQVADQLQQAGIITSPSIFILGVRASGNGVSVKAGEYSIPERASNKMVMDIITGGQTYIRRLSVPEGLTSAQVVALIEKAEGLTGLISQTPKNGTLLPETYYYSYGDTKESLLERMQNAMNRAKEELWEKRQDNLPFQTIDEAIVLASIVEKETGIGSERAQVASVFVNRLRKHMKLQSDPTVIYAVTDGTMDLKRKLTLKDLRKYHPFNTYVIDGLPPAAIVNPGYYSLRAVLNPNHTNYLYFVADGTGGHTFSQTYNDHVKNVENWRSINKQK